MITTWSVNTPPSVTWLRAIFLHALQKKLVMTDVVSAPVSAVFISTLMIQSVALVKTPSVSATATCSKCTKRLLMRTVMCVRCGSTRRLTMVWAVSGLITSVKAISPACLFSVRQTSLFTVRTVSVLLH